MNLLKIPYRPLMGGIGIVPSTTRRWATAGFFAQGHGKRWLVTAAHAIGPLAPGTSLTIHQGPWGQSGLEIAVATDQEILINAALDITAIPVAAGLLIRPEIVGLGAWSGPAGLTVGAEVVKVGVGSGFVRGRVTAINGSEIRIGRLANYPAQYSVAETGDSGAAWLTWPSLSVAAVHTGKAASGEAIASSAGDLLASLGLSLA
jgi:hypothetical protein